MRTIRTSAEQAGAQAPAEGSDTLGRPQAGEERKKGRKGQNIAGPFHRSLATLRSRKQFFSSGLASSGKPSRPAGAGRDPSGSNKNSFLVSEKGPSLSCAYQVN